jgi:hypothetical protein
MLPVALSLQVVCCRVDTSSHVLTRDTELHCEEKFVISAATVSAVNSLVSIGGKIYPCIHTAPCHGRPDANRTARMVLVVSILNLILIVSFYLYTLKGFISEQVERKCLLTAGKVLYNIPITANTIVRHKAVPSPRSFFDQCGCCRGPSTLAWWSSKKSPSHPTPLHPQPPIYNHTHRVLHSCKNSVTGNRTPATSALA